VVEVGVGASPAWSSDGRRPGRNRHRGLVGGAVALVAGEALERHEGRAAKTIDAVDDEPVPHG
jgi:hypothetical protein